MPSGKEARRFCSDVDSRVLLEHLKTGHTVQRGRLDDHYRTRTYVKRTDHVGGIAHQLLPLDQHRVRLECTLTGPLCPFGSLQEWRVFTFASLKSYFAFRVLTVNPDSACGNAAGWMSAGRAVDEEKQRQHRRTLPQGSKADSVSYEVVRGALRRLTTAQRKGRWSPANARCGNPEEFAAGCGPRSQGEATETELSPKYFRYFKDKENTSLLARCGDGGTSVQPLQSRSSPPPEASAGSSSPTSTCIQRLQRGQNRGTFHPLSRMRAGVALPSAFSANSRSVRIRLARQRLACPMASQATLPSSRLRSWSCRGEVEPGDGGAALGLPASVEDGLVDRLQREPMLR